MSTNLEADISITFPIGEVAGSTGKATQALQLLVGGIVFSRASWPWRRSVCR